MSTFVRQHSKGDQGASIDSNVPDKTSVDKAGENTRSLGQGQRYSSSKPIRRESRLTLGGAVYVAVTVFLAIGAINSQNNLLFWLFGVAIATLIVSGVFSGSALMKIRLQAHSIPDARAGDAIRLHYMVTNHSRFFPLFAAMITEIPGSSEPAEDGQLPNGQFESGAVIHIGPGKQQRVVGSFTPSQRGRFTVNRIRLSTRFPFGLLQKSLIFESSRSLVVLPYLLNIKPELVRVIQGHGEEVRKRTDSSGSSSEYWGLREYVHGDSKRSIAWKQSARTNRLVVIEHAQPISTKLWIWIAVSQIKTDEDPLAIERAISLAASLIFQAANRGTPVGLWAPALGLRVLPGTGKAQAQRCLRSLAILDPQRIEDRDSPPKASSTDDVISIVSVSHSPNHSDSLQNIRSLSTQDPSVWLIDPTSLPPALESHIEHQIEGGG